MQHQCNLIIDSCCDLPFEVVDREGVELIKFPYVMRDGEHADDLYQTSSAYDFYQAMRDGDEPTTAGSRAGVSRRVHACYRKRRSYGVLELFKRLVGQLRCRRPCSRAVDGRTS